MLFSVSLIAQKLEVSKPSQVIGQINHMMLTKGESGNYILCFDNTQYQTISDIKCINLGDEEFVNSLYTSLSENFKKENPDSFKLEIDNKHLEFKYVKMIGMQSMYIVIYEGNGIFSTSTYFTPKKLDKIFGK